MEFEILEKTMTALEGRQLVMLSKTRNLFGRTATEIIITETGRQYVDDYLNFLREIWTRMIKLVSEEGREGLDQFVKNEPYTVNLMVFFGIVDLQTLTRLNLRYLLQGRKPCYCCKKELDLKLMQKFTVKDCQKMNFKIPIGMADEDELCANCFDNLDMH